MNLGGHVRTVGTLLRRRLWPPLEPEYELWEGLSPEPGGDPVKISGRLSRAGEHDRLLLAVHGLGGSSDSLYLREFATAAIAGGWSILRIDLRGADRLGEDYYNGGQTVDLHAALAAPELASFSEVAVVGFSLGGHAVLRYATEPGDPRLRAIATICPPVDLAAGQQLIDSGSARIYRRYVLDHIKEIYRAVAARREVPLPVAEADGIDRLWDWDERIIAPRYGFAGAEDYYAKVSVGPRLGELRVPTLVVASEADPMVPADSLRRRLSPPPQGVEVCWPSRSGHLSFPRNLDLGFGPRRGIFGQVVGWLEATVR